MRLLSFASLLGACVVAVHGSIVKVPRPHQLAARDCTHNNCLRQLIGASNKASTFCATYTTAVQTATTGLPTYVSQCDASPSKISSACSCIITSTAGPSTTSTSTTTGTPTPTTSPTSSTSSVSTATDNWDPNTYSSTFAGATLSADETITADWVTVTTPTVTATALPMRIGPWDGTNGTLDSIKAEPVKKFLAGQDNGDGSYLLTVFKLTARAGFLLINLEDFAPFLAGTVCSPSTITLTFTTPEAKAAALASWQPGMGIVTSGADLCGVHDDKRTYYLVASILAGTEPGSLSVALAVAEGKMQDVADVLRVDYGTLEPGMVSETAPEVGEDVAPAWDAIVDFFNQPEQLRKRAGAEKSTVLYMDTNWFIDWFRAGYKMPLWLLPNPINPDKFNMVCRECGFWARILFQGGFEVPFWHPQDAWVYMSMDIYDIRLKQNWFIQAFDAFDLVKTWKFVLGGFSPFDLYVPGIMKIGPIVELAAVLRASVGTLFDVADLGFEVHNNVQSGIRISTDRGGKQYGWDYSFTPLKPAFDLTGTHIDFVGGLAPSLEFALEFFDDIPFVDFGWTSFFRIEVPQVSAKFTRPDPGQKCYRAEDAVDYQIDLSIGADVTTGLEGTYVPDNWVYHVWDTVWWGYSMCGRINYHD